eukprot:XP_001699313.1 predicted protein [Chlamydomonas reinhardtii]
MATELALFLLRLRARHAAAECGARCLGPSPPCSTGSPPHVCGCYRCDLSGCSGRVKLRARACCMRMHSCMHGNTALPAKNPYGNCWML